MTLQPKVWAISWLSPPCPEPESKPTLSLSSGSRLVQQPQERSIRVLRRLEDTILGSAKHAVVDVVAAATHGVLVERPRRALAVLLDDLISYFLFRELFIREVAGRLGVWAAMVVWMRRGDGLCCWLQNLLCCK